MVFLVAVAYLPTHIGQQPGTCLHIRTGQSRRLCRRRCRVSGLDMIGQEGEQHHQHPGGH